MKPDVKAICAFMNTWAPPGLAYPWDRVGLQTGNPSRHVETVLVCLTVTREALAAALRAKAEMIIAHHPLIWTPLKTLCQDAPTATLCLELVRADIACFAAHTNLDIAPGGVNDALAGRLGLRDGVPLFRDEHLQQVKVVTFVPESHRNMIRDALAGAGAGVIGDYTHCSFNAAGTGTFLPGDAANPYLGGKGVVNQAPEWRLEMVADKARLSLIIKALYQAHPYEEPAYDIIPLENPNKALGLGVLGHLEKKTSLAAFSRHVCRVLGLEHVHVYGAGNKAVASVAALAGSGGSYIERLPEDVDVYVSGDISYHAAEAALLRGIPCIDAGHRGTELPIVDGIAKRLRKEFRGLAVKTFKERAAARLVTAHARG